MEYEHLLFPAWEYPGVQRCLTVGDPEDPWHSVLLTAHERCLCWSPDEGFSQSNTRTPVEGWRWGSPLSSPDQRSDHKCYAENGTAFSRGVSSPKGQWGDHMVTPPRRHRQSPAGMDYATARQRQHPPIVSADGVGLSISNIWKSSAHSAGVVSATSMGSAREVSKTVEWVSSGVTSLPPLKCMDN